jgi:hypothetical protein
MRPITLGIAALVVVALAAEARADGAAGRWEASVQGQQLVLILAPDGTGTLNGEPGRWQVSGQTIVLSDDGGFVLRGRYTGTQIAFELEGVALTFRRAGGAAGRGATPGGGDRATPAASGGPFKPARLLRGRTVKPKGTHVSFTVPQGWQSKWVERDGNKVFTIYPAKLEERGAVFATGQMLDLASRRLPMEQLLVKAAEEALGEARATVVQATESFTVDGKPAGRIGFRVQGGAEVYLGLVVIDGFAYVILGLYEPDLADTFRPGIDTILATFKGKAPPRNTALERKLAGCWSSFEGSGGSTGSGSSNHRWVFAGDGSYQHRAFLSVSVEGMSSQRDHREQGGWFVYGNELSTQPEEGKPSSYVVRFEGRMLWLGNRRFLPCS